MRRIPMLALLLAAFTVVPAARGAAQVTVASPSDGSGEALRVYLDCQYYCDFDYIRTEIPFVSYVRDRADAQVHILVTRQATGGGGSEFALSFIGKEDHEGTESTLRYVAAQTNTQDDTRSGMVRVLKMGLMPYVAGTALAERIEISFEEAEEKAAGPTGTPSEAEDPWKQWVFRVGVSGWLNGESSYGFTNVNGSFSANRITETWKVELDLNTGIDRSTQDVGDRVIKTERTDYGFSTLIVRSMGTHWSSGMRIRSRHSTYYNQDLMVRIGPAIEYNVYPYTESTRRQLRVQYSTGVSAFDYIDETIYFKTNEQLVDHELNVALGLRQPWGNANISVNGSQYLQQTDRYQLGVGGSMSFRLVKGLSLQLGGSYQRIRNRIYLAAGGATEEEILLRRKQLDTSYSYFMNFGVRYSFGSIFNNVVNPRFGGSDGMFFF